MSSRTEQAEKDYFIHIQQEKPS